MKSEDEEFEIDLDARGYGTVKRIGGTTKIDVHMDPDGTIRDGSGKALLRMVWVDGEFKVVAFEELYEEFH